MDRIGINARQRARRPITHTLQISYILKRPMFFISQPPVTEFCGFGNVNSGLSMNFTAPLRKLAKFVFEELLDGFVVILMAKFVFEELQS